jgi:hypothetical protein
VASRDEVEAALAFQGEEEQVVLSSFDQEVEVPWVSGHTEEELETAVVAHHQA